MQLPWEGNIRDPWNELCHLPNGNHRGSMQSPAFLSPFQMEGEKWRAQKTCWHLDQPADGWACHAGQFKWLPISLPSLPNQQMQVSSGIPFIHCLREAMGGSLPSKVRKHLKVPRESFHTWILTAAPTEQTLQTQTGLQINFSQQPDPSKLDLVSQSLRAFESRSYGCSVFRHV